MQYINPYELLNLSTGNSYDITSTNIRRARTALFHQIDLSISDNNSIGSITFRKIHLTKADCIKIIDELDDDNKKEFHFFIYQNKHLNDFLTEGTISFFDNYRVESIYSSSEFIDFISPYFSEQYNKELSQYFEKWNAAITTKLLLVNPIVNTEYTEKCYSNVRLFLRSITDEITNINEKVKKKSVLINSDLFNEKCFLITKTINTKLLNLLPSSQFQNVRNVLAKAISQFAITVHNIEIDKLDSDKTKNHSLCFLMTEVAKAIDCTGLEEKSIRESYYIQKKNLENFQSRLELAKKSPVLNKYLQLSDAIVKKIDEIDNKTTTPDSIKTWLNNTINTSEINLLDRTFIETKNEIALLLKSLSVSIWNKHDDIDIALFTLSKAMTINTDESTKSKLLSSKHQLEDLKLKIEERKEVSRQKVSSYKSKEKSNYGVLVLISIIIFIIYLASNSNNSRNSSNTNTYPSNNNYSAPSTTTDTTSSSSNSSSQSSNSYPVDSTSYKEPVYVNVTVKNGNFSNCSGITPSYDRSINTRLIISTELTDAAVKIFDYQTDKCIRFVFINDETTYTVKNIPEGRYYLKIAYGNDWSVKEGEPICSGHFSSHASYKRDNSIYDFNRTISDDGRVSIPYYTLKLYRTYTTDYSVDNTVGNSISETDFNN